MKAFIDRNFFLYNHNRKCKAKSVGVIIVAESEGIEDTLHTLKRFIVEPIKVKADSILTACGFAGRMGEVKNNQPLVEEAQKLGRQMVENLKGKG